MRDNSAGGLFLDSGRGYRSPISDRRRAAEALHNSGVDVEQLVENMYAAFELSQLMQILQNEIMNMNLTDDDTVNMSFCPRDYNYHELAEGCADFLIGLLREGQFNDDQCNGALEISDNSIARYENTSNYIKTAGVLLAVILAGSCTDHDEVREKTNTLKLLVSSHSFLAPDQPDKYPSTHAVGLFSLDKNMNQTNLLNNQKAISNGSKWYLDKNCEVRLGEDSVNAYAYYPYDPNMQSDEWLRINTGKTDYMYGLHDIEEYGYINYAQPIADIKMRHAMCMLKLDIRPILEQGCTVSHIYIEGADPVHPIYSTGQINMFTDETGSLQVLDGEMECEIDETGQKALLYMIPCKGVAINITVIVNGRTYTLPVKDLNFGQGMVQNFWLGFDVAEENLYLKGVNIVPWEDGQNQT